MCLKKETMSSMADKEWASRYPERNAAKQRRYAENNQEKVRESRLKWIAANPERHKQIMRESAVRRRKRVHLEMIKAYGGKCSCCGEASPAFLSLEHIGGMQGKPRVQTHTELRRLKAEGWPDDCTCLCFNCNLGSWRNGGTCPHINIVEEEDDGEPQT
jgi:hypothetical protein